MSQQLSESEKLEDKEQIEGAEDSAIVEGTQQEKKVLNPYEEKLKKSYEDFMAIIEKESKKEIPLP